MERTRTQDGSRRQAALLRLSTAIAEARSAELANTAKSQFLASMSHELVESAPGAGTTFSVVVPAVPPAAAPDITLAGAGAA